MEMEDHQHHQYGIADLRHFMNARPTTSTSVGSNLFTQPTAELINNTVHHHHQQQQQQQHHHSSNPQTYHEQKRETNEIVFGAVQEQDGRREAVVIDH